MYIYLYIYSPFQTHQLSSLTGTFQQLSCLKKQYSQKSCCFESHLLIVWFRKGITVFVFVAIMNPWALGFHWKGSLKRIRSQQSFEGKLYCSPTFRLVDLCRFLSIRKFSLTDTFKSTLSTPFQCSSSLGCSRICFELLVYTFCDVW